MRPVCFWESFVSVAQTAWGGMSPSTATHRRSIARSSVARPLPVRPCSCYWKTSLFDPVAGEDISPPVAAYSFDMQLSLLGVQMMLALNQQRIVLLRHLLGADEGDGGIRLMLSNTTMASASPGVGISFRQLCGTWMGPQQQGSPWTCGEERKALRPAPGAGRR